MGSLGATWERMRHNLNGVCPWCKKRHSISQRSLLGCVLGAWASGGTLVLRSNWMVTRDCAMELVEGTDIKDIKEEALGFGRGLDMGSRGHWEVRCFGTDPGTALLTEWATLCGVYQLSLGLGHIVGKLLVSPILCSLDRCQAGVI